MHGEPPRLAAVPDDDCDPDQVRRLTGFRKAHPRWEIWVDKGNHRWYARSYGSLVSKRLLSDLLDELDRIEAR